MKEELTSPKKYIRAEKTGRAVDDFKVLFVGVAIAIVMLIGQFTIQTLSEQRWFRDATVATPFHSVVVTTQSLNENHHEITVTGWMTKRRCEFRSLTGYVIDENGIRNRVYVNTTPEDILTGMGLNSNRPPSNQSEHWGPWLIQLEAETNVPFAWEIWAHHQCPNQRTIQSNLFAEGLWQEFTIGEEP